MQSLKIAVIEDNQDYQDLLKESLKDTAWTINYFHDSIDFGQAHLDFDIILSDCMLPTMNGSDLLHSIAQKTNAELVLMSSVRCIDEDNYKSQRISAMLDKTNVNVIVSHLKYLDAKIRIKKYAEIEHMRFENLVTSNEYSIEIKNDIIILGIMSILSNKSREEIKERINHDYYKGILFFPDKRSVQSIFLGELVHFYKLFKDKKGLAVFWNATNSDVIANQLISCRINKILPIFENLEEAIDYLHHQNLFV